MSATGCPPVPEQVPVAAGEQAVEVADVLDRRVGVPGGGGRQAGLDLIQAIGELRGRRQQRSHVHASALSHSGAGLRHAGLEHAELCKALAQ